MSQKNLIQSKEASWIPVGHFIASVLLGGLLLWIGNHIFNALQSLYPTGQTWWIIASFIISAMPVIILLGAIIWLMLHMQKESYAGGVPR